MPLVKCCLSVVFYTVLESDLALTSSANWHRGSTVADEALARHSYKWFEEQG